MRQRFNTGSRASSTSKTIQGYYTRETRLRRAKYREQRERGRREKNKKKKSEIFRRLCSWGPCRAIKLRNGGSPLDVWRELHSLVKASRNSRRYRHRRGYINVSSYVLTAYLSLPPLSSSLLFPSFLSLSILPLRLMYITWCTRVVRVSTTGSSPPSLFGYIMRSGGEYMYVCTRAPTSLLRSLSLSLSSCLFVHGITRARLGMCHYYLCEIYFYSSAI